jgi:DNA-directed RNA polymerase subunit F
MIKKSEPLSLAEVKELLKKLPESEQSKAVATYIKKFVKITASEAEKLTKEIEELMPNLNKEHIIKIADILPRDADDLRKILADVTLDENEITKLLEIVKKYL